MSLDFREIGFGFGPVTGKSQELTYEMDFGQKVSKATVALKSFISRFVNSDHELHALEIITSISRIQNTKVTVKVTFLLRDYSGNIDDKFSGAVHVVVFADLAGNVQPPIFLNLNAKASKKAVKKKTANKK